MSRPPVLSLCCVLVLGFLAAPVWAQRVPEALAPLNAFSVGAEFSNDSTHIILGQAYDRRLAGVDLTYSRRVGRNAGLAYTWDIALRPITYLQDPVQTVNDTTTSQNGTVLFHLQRTAPVLRHCRPSSFTGPVQITFPSGTPQTFEVDDHTTCSSRWTYAAGISPLGQRLNLLPRHRVQPYLFANGGLLVATREVPVNGSSYFNFTFDFGSGLAWWTKAGSAWAFDYRVQHMSSKNLGRLNPGVDSQVFRLSYTVAHLPFTRQR